MECSLLSDEGFWFHALNSPIGRYTIPLREAHNRDRWAMNRLCTYAIKLDLDRK